MSNLVLCYTNRGDAAVLTAGNWSGALPRANLQTQDVSQVARTTDATLASTTFSVDFGAAKTLRAIALVNHNLTTAALWRIQSSDAVYDSGWINALQLTFRGDTPSNWGAQYQLLHVPAAPLAARYLQLSFNDTANAAGYLQFGRFIAMGGLQPAKNASFGGLRSGHSELSSVAVSPAGKKFFTERRRLRRENFTLNWLTPTEAEQLHEFQAEVGTTREVLYVPNPADAAYSQRYGFLGTMRELSDLEYPYVTTRALAFQLEEKI
jgi:hypothetical protein